MSEGQDTADAVPDRVRANRDATDWLILLAEEPGDADLQSRFSAWLQASPTNAAAWTETDRISSAILSIPPAHSQRWQTAGELRPPRDRRAIAPARKVESRRGWRPARRIGAFAVLAAAACFSLVALPDLLVRLRTDAVAATGEVGTMRLADGSTMRLAPRSAVAIAMEHRHRKVRILRGSAYFDVTHDPARPFEVTAAGSTTTVLGTAFEVGQKEGGQVGVSVRRGLVRVACDDRPDTRELLTVGDGLDLDCGANTAERRRIQPSRIAAWMDGRVIASDRPVREVIDALRPWHSGIVITLGSGLDTRRVTGVYDARQPDRALRALAASHHVKIRQVTPWITVITAD